MTKASVVGCPTFVPLKLDNITTKIQSFIADQTASNVEVKSHTCAFQKKKTFTVAQVTHLPSLHLSSQSIRTFDSFT
jgi:hypothetical protein